MYPFLFYIALDLKKKKCYQFSKNQSVKSDYVDKFSR